MYVTFYGTHSLGIMVSYSCMHIGNCDRVTQLVINLHTTFLIFTLLTIMVYT